MIKNKKCYNVKNFDETGICVDGYRTHCSIGKWLGNREKKTNLSHFDFISQKKKKKKPKNLKLISFSIIELSNLNSKQSNDQNALYHPRVDEQY